AAAAELVPGWLGAPLEAFPALSPLPVPGLADGMPRFVRVGVAQPLDDVRFPAVVPLLGAGHLAINGDARDPRVAGLLTSLVLRLVAAAPAGDLRIRAVDSTGSVFGAFAALVPAGVMAEPVADRNGLRAVLSEAEQWVRSPGRYTLLVVVAALPELTEGPELARLAMLAQSGPQARLHLIVAGWPPPPLTADTTQPPLAYTTQITLRNPHALVGDPPGGTFGHRRALNAPVYLDSAPPAETIHRVCQSVAEHVARSLPTLRDLLPEALWQGDSADGLAVEVGEAGGHPVTLRLADLTPHWLIGGRSGAGKTAFLIDVLYGLAARYGPDQLTLYLLDFKEGVSFTEFTPTERDPSWIPQARAVGIESDREYGLAVLRELDAEMTRRGDAFKRAGVSRYVDLRAAARGDAPGRIVCVIDEFQVLVQGTDRLARDAVALLESLARKGRSYGIHLILASQTVRGVESLYAKRDSIFGQFPVRVALPGGGDVLDPLNSAADPLALGQAVVNTAGGLGGPTGAARAHERVIDFPDPHADPAILDALRHRLWQSRPPQARPPHVFAGYARQYLPESVPRQETRTAYLGRA
ncbi:MAG TPA: FtsK/SpoIIIE domain-containing protein, partial [Rugosimonospora sp.]|nr:FtsK/SpoIIIE domain-containing protein [Rugosimonospora sp.]